MYAAACAYASKCRTPNVCLHTLRHTPSLVFLCVMFPCACNPCIFEFGAVRPCRYSLLCCSVPGWLTALVIGEQGRGCGLLRASAMPLPVPPPSHSHVVCLALGTCHPHRWSYCGLFCIHMKAGLIWPYQTANMCKILSCTNLF